MPEKQSKKKQKKIKIKPSPNNDFQQEHFLDFQLKEPMMKQHENFASNFSSKKSQKWCAELF